MPVILVANPKGGVGKSTLASNVAGFLAHRGHAVMLGDIDRQQSSARWLAQRPAALPEIRGWELASTEQLRTPKGVSHAVLDTPAGLHGGKFEKVMKLADKVIVPLGASMFDIMATQAFLQELKDFKGKADIGVVGMRINARTRAAEQLQHYVNGLGLPVLGFIRDTQNYVQLAAQGATIWDAAPSRVEKDLEQWGELVRWVQV